MPEPSSNCAEFSLLASRVDAIGCSDDEIARVSSDQGRELPGPYRCFLKAMGRDLGGLFEGALVSYPYVLGLRDAAVDLLAENLERGRDAFELPDDAVVLSMHDQWYGFEFVRTSSGDDPSVEQWIEGELTPRVVEGSVLAWVRSAFASGTAPSRDAARRHHQDLLRRGFDTPLCPACGEDWSAYGETQRLPSATRANDASIVACRGCGQRSRWWWGQPPRLIG